MGIVNTGQVDVYHSFEGRLLERVEDCILNCRPDATENMLE